MSLSAFFDAARHELSSLDATATRDAAFAAFASEARRIWRNADTALERTVLSDEEPDGNVLASLAYTGSARAIGQIIFAMPLKYTLRVATALLSLDGEIIRRTMGHEAIHLGIRNHGAEFQRTARQFGLPISGRATKEGTDDVVVEQKVGARFRPVARFPSVAEATSWAREQMRASAGMRFRLSL